MRRCVPLFLRASVYQQRMLQKKYYFKKYMDEEYAYLKGKFRFSQEEVEGVYMEAFMAAYKGVVTQQFQWKSSFKTYLYKIVNNKAVDLLRKKKRQDPDTDLDEMPHIIDIPSALFRR